MYKVKEIKNMKFDCFYMGTEYMDHWQMDLKELDRFATDCEYMFGNKWEPIFIKSFYSDASLCTIVDLLYKHNYITCFSGEMDREFNGTLTGHSTLLEYVKNSNYKERCEKARQKWLKECKRVQNSVQ